MIRFWYEANLESEAADEPSASGRDSDCDSSVWKPTTYFAQSTAAVSRHEVAHSRQLKEESPYFMGVGSIGSHTPRDGTQTSTQA